MRALSAVDVAVWDLAGQYVSQPIYNLMGGRYRDEVPIYNTCVNSDLYQDQDEFVKRPGALAESLLAEGITHMKVWPWDHVGPQYSWVIDGDSSAWSVHGPVGYYLSTDALKSGLRIVEEIRGAVGDRMQISIEGHSRWDLNCALRIARALEPYDIAWLEDIIQPDSVDDLARLVGEPRVPHCVSERRSTRNAFREILQRGAAHIVMPDVTWSGGLTEGIKIAALTDAHHLPIAPHDYTGPVNLVASLHLCAASPNAMVMETVRGFHRGYYRELVTGAVTIRDGVAVCDFGSGLGVKLRPELLRRSDVSVRVSTGD